MKQFKRIFFLIAALLSLSTAANARLYLGGGLSFGSSNGQLRIHIAPEVGYHLTNHFTVGGRVSYESGVDRLGINPYARLNIFGTGAPIRLMATVEAPFQWAGGYFGYGVFLRPGLSVRLAGSVRLEGHFGYFGWGSVRNDGVTTRGWQYTIGSNSISLGVVIGL